MGNDLLSQMLGAYALIFGIWGIVGLLVYVWYLWALSRLFPYLDLPSSHGWIPVWNQWRLIERGGLPGWMVLLGFIPGLAIVVLVVSIIAIHRINQEHGEGGGMTVLGAFIPPLWAMLLANRLRDRGYAPGAQHQGVQQNGAPAFQSASGFQGAPGFQGSRVAPAAGSPGLVEYGPDGQAYPRIQGGAPQPPAMQPPAPQPAAPSAQPQLAVPPAQNAPPPAPPTAPAAAPNTATPPAVQPRFAAPASQPSAPAVPQAPQPPQLHAPGVPTPAENPWSLGKTIDSNFERLANEEPPARSASLGSAPDARPFSWPEPQPVASAPPAAPPTAAPPAQVPPAPPAPPAAAAPRYAAPVPQQSEQQAQPQVSANQAAPVQSAPTPPAPTRAQPPLEPQPPAEPRRAAAPEPAPEAAPEPEVEEGFTATVLTEAQQAPGSTADETEEELDRTVVVARRARWVLELPDGRVLDLDGDDIVIGRKPVAIEDSAVVLVPDPTRTLSKSHARLRRNGESWTIEDLGSTNGVFVFDEGGAQLEIESGRQTPASGQLILGTLEVRLRVAD